MGSWSPATFTNIFQLEDFFDRYHPHVFDACHVPFFEPTEDDADLGPLEDELASSSSSTSTSTHPNPNPSNHRNGLAQPRLPLPNQYYTTPAPTAAAAAYPNTAVVAAERSGFYNAPDPAAPKPASTAATTLLGSDAAMPLPGFYDFDPVGFEDVYGGSSNGGHVDTGGGDGGREGGGGGGGGDGNGGNGGNGGGDMMEAERDPLLRMLAEMAERDGGVGADDARGLDVWMGGGG